MDDVDVKDGSWAGGRVQARLLIQDPGGRVLVLPAPDGEGWQLPGGPLGEYDSLVEAARRGGELQLGGIVTVGVPLSVSLSQGDGLVVILSGDVYESALLPFAAPAAQPTEVREAVRSRADGRIRYREVLWWPPGPHRGHGGSIAPSLAELLSDWVDTDIAAWTMGVGLGVFPTTTTFGQVRFIVSGLGHPFADVSLALDRVLAVLAGIGVLEDDGAECRWSNAVEMVS